MSDDYVEIEDVTLRGIAPSGKAIFVLIDGKDRTVPVSQVARDSEIWHLAKNGAVGTLKVARWFAEKEELLDGEREGSGLVLRKLPRSRLTPPKTDPDHGCSEGRLKRIERRLYAATHAAEDWHADPGDNAVYAGEPGEPVRMVAVFDCEGLRDEQAIANAVWCANAPEDMRRLINEVRALRAWADKVTGGKKS
jgi:hypothetical protein